MSLWPKDRIFKDHCRNLAKECVSQSFFNMLVLRALFGSIEFKSKVKFWKWGTQVDILESICCRRTYVKFLSMSKGPKTIFWMWKKSWFLARQKGVSHHREHGKRVQVENSFQICMVKGRKLRYFDSYCFSQNKNPI